jgi:predicted nucleotidyltransferase
MLRDKDYLTTDEGLIFNVIGYDHPPGRVTANLKYVSGCKWSGAYEAALHFLSKEYPRYVAGFVSVPEACIRNVLRPQDGLRRIRRQTARNRLEQTALDLADLLADFLEIPTAHFGITDSLLWGRGGDASDVDLVVYGTDAAVRVLSRLPALWTQPNFERLRVDNFSRSASCCADELPEQCRRKINKGLYRGIRFSLRAVRGDGEIEQCGPYRTGDTVQVTARVTDNSASLFFPATYRLDCELDAVSFRVRDEAAFAVDEELTICGRLEYGRRDRIVVGSLHSPDHKMQPVGIAEEAILTAWRPRGDPVA